MNADEFWALVDRSDADGCWPWLGGQNGNGRGRVRFDGRHQYAYRIAWQLTHGTPIPSGLLACHHCDNPSCVRPSHIFVGTDLDNVRDAVEKGRHSHGHVYGEDHHSAVTPDSVVREARERYARGGIEPCELADELGVTRSTMQNWLRGRVRIAAGGPIVARLKSETRHGTNSSYQRRGCRCEPCRQAGAAYRLLLKMRRSGSAA